MTPDQIEELQADARKYFPMANVTQKMGARGDSYIFLSTQQISTATISKDAPIDFRVKGFWEQIIRSHAAHIAQFDPLLKQLLEELLELRKRADFGRPYTSSFALELDALVESYENKIAVKE